MFIGADISHWNGDFDITFGDFVIMKATEGTTLVDSMLVKRLDTFLAINKIYRPRIGFYHFARPDISKNTPVIEAVGFVNTIKPFLQFNPLLVVDWEAKAINKKYNDYCVKLLEEIEKLTGVRPVLYTNTSGTKVLGKTCTSYPLWIASYNKKTPAFYNWDNYSLWQFTSTPFDLNLLNGEVEEWTKLVSKR